MMGNPVNKDATHIIGVIPRQSIGAEIGVWMGNTSFKFFQRGLKHLHLVDSWSPVPYEQQKESEHGSYEQYLQKYSRIVGSEDPDKFQEYYDKVYNQVVEKFKPHNNVTIHRMTSREFFKNFDGELDWIYIDGDHSYEGCLFDLEQSRHVVKPGGKILGDDYRWTEKYGKFGVTQAVDEFVSKYNYELIQHGMLQFEIKV